MARLRILLTDGSGPLFVDGSGSLAAELHAVQAALQTTKLSERSLTQ